MFLGSIRNPDSDLLLVKYVLSHLGEMKCVDYTPMQSWLMDSVMPFQKLIDNILPSFGKLMKVKDNYVCVDYP